MLVLITYDVSQSCSISNSGDINDSGAKRLRKIAKVCQDYGQRVQYSVFECDIDPAQFVTFKQKLFDIYDESLDSLRFYKLGKHGQQKIEHYGAKASFDLFKDPLII